MTDTSINGPTSQNLHRKPLLLDLYSGAGGCSYGYHLAGFDVVGCDIVPMPRYPFEFYQDDALNVLDTLLNGNTWHGYHLKDFAAIHASPPCQHYTTMINNNEHCRVEHPDLIAPTRSRLMATGKPYIIENVKGAKKEIPNAFSLCGCMFPGLRVKRERLFESNVLIFSPFHDKKYCRSIRVAHASRIPRGDEWWSAIGCFGQKDQAQRAMGITWMKTTGSRDTEIAQAIPPAYTKWIGQQLLDYINQEVDGGAA